jgi:hypothetical protein
MLMTGCIGMFYPFRSLFERCSLKFAGLHEVEATGSRDSRDAGNRNIRFCSCYIGLLFLLFLIRLCLDRSGCTRGVELMLSCFQ